MKKFQRFLTLVLALCFAHATMIQSVQAGLLSTEEVVRIGTARKGDSPAHERLSAMLARADVQAELERFGLSPDLARERIAALTDQEAERLALEIENAPAGAGIIGALLLVFFVLLVTDILGLTRVFPFTRPVR